MPRFAANLSMMFNEVDFLDRFAAAKRHGFPAVEYLFPYAHQRGDLAERLQGEGLQQVLFNAPPGNWDQGERGIGGLPGREDEFRKSIELALGYAQALNCPRIHVMAGLVPAGSDPARHRDTFAANLAWASPLAKEAGVVLLLEPLNAVDFPGYLVGSIATAKAIIAASCADNVFLQYDVYHMQMSQGRLAQSFHDHMDAIRHVQIAGVPGRHEPDASQEINFPMLFLYLDSVAYAGWIGCEYRPRARTEVGLGWAAEFGIR
ncbi:MAG TPA: 2-oxo-tetronate isomerase [Candidatus Binatia bacterium]|nr:2-oxo-tetronate isomerase [Candidatus Binatia bacterium]